MKFITVPTYEKMSRQAANIISAQVIMKPDCDRFFARWRLPPVDRLVQQGGH